MNEKAYEVNDVQVNGKLVSYDAFTKLDKSTILRFKAMSCTYLMSLDLPAATYVDVSGCTSLVSLDLPDTTWVDVRGCTGLSSDVITHLKIQCGDHLTLDEPCDASQAECYG